MERQRPMSEEIVQQELESMVLAREVAIYVMIIMVLHATFHLRSRQFLATDWPST